MRCICGFPVVVSDCMLKSHVHLLESPVCFLRGTKSIARSLRSAQKTCCCGGVYRDVEEVQVWNISET